MYDVCNINQFTVRHNSSSRGLGEDCHSPVLESCEDSVSTDAHACIF
jgi:hypothetical protein